MMETYNYRDAVQGRKVMGLTFAFCEKHVQTNHYGADSILHTLFGGFSQALEQGCEYCSFTVDKLQDENGKQTGVVLLHLRFVESIPHFMKRTKPKALSSHFESN